MSLSFLEAVARTASLPVTGRELYGIVKAAPIRDTQMLHLSVRYKSAGEARDLASAIARAFISKASEGVQQRRDLIRVHLEAVDAQLALIQRIQQSNWAKLDQQQQGATIRGEEGAVNRALTLNTLRVSETLFKELRKDLTAELSTLEPPVLIEPPFIPAQSKNLRIFADMVLAAVLGLLAGSALAFFIDDFRSLRPAPIQTRLAEATSDPRRSKELGG